MYRHLESIDEILTDHVRQPRAGGNSTQTSLQAKAVNGLGGWVCLCVCSLCLWGCCCLLHRGVCWCCTWCVWWGRGDTRYAAIFSRSSCHHKTRRRFVVRGKGGRGALRIEPVSAVKAIPRSSRLRSAESRGSSCVIRSRLLRLLASAAEEHHHHHNKTARPIGDSFLGLLPPRPAHLRCVKSRCKVVVTAACRAVWLS